MKYLFWLSFLWLLIVYVIYPTLLYFKTRNLKGDKSTLAAYPTITIIIPCYNEESAIINKIRNLRNLIYPKNLIKIIFVNDGSTDNTLRILKRCKSIGNYTIVNNEIGLGKTQSLKKAAEQVNSKMIVFTDCTANLNKSALKHLLLPFNNPKVGLVTGSYKSVPKTSTNRSDGEGLYWRFEKNLRNQESLLSTTTHATGAIYAIRTSIFKNIEVPVGIINDDLFIPLKVIESDFLIKAANKAIATEYVNCNNNNEISRRIRISMGNYQMFREIPNLLMAHKYFVLVQLTFHKWLRSLGGIAICLQILSSAFLLDGAIYQVALGFWLFIITLFLSSVTFKPSFKIVTAAHYFMLTNIAGLLGFLKYLFSKNAVQWNKTDSVY